MKFDKFLIDFLSIVVLGRKQSYFASFIARTTIESLWSIKKTESNLILSFLCLKIQFLLNIDWLHSIVSIL